MIFCAGDRVRLKYGVDRFPHFRVEAGAVGTIVAVGRSNHDEFRVRMDNKIVGCEDWDNEIVWNLSHEDPVDDLVHVSIVDLIGEMS